MMFAVKMTRNMISENYDVIRPALNCVTIYFVWMVVHYASVHIYSNVCAPLSIRGFIASAFLVPSPHCEALGWIIYNGSLNSRAMWVMFGCYISTKLELRRWV
jgi:hypothetical protein